MFFVGVRGDFRHRDGAADSAALPTRSRCSYHLAGCSSFGLATQSLDFGSGKERGARAPARDANDDDDDDDDERASATI